MDKSVTLPCDTPMKETHFLNGVAASTFPAGEKWTVSLVVRLDSADGKTEDDELKIGIQFADSGYKVDVPKSSSRSLSS